MTTERPASGDAPLQPQTANGYSDGCRSRPYGSPAIDSVCKAQSHWPSRRIHVDASAASRVTGFPSTVSFS